MTTMKAKAEISLIVHLPDACAGRFHFVVMRHMDGKDRALDPAEVGHLFPELAPYLNLHESDHDGTPKDVEVRAWYHVAGICFPGTEGSDPSDRVECARRLIALLRVPASRVADMVVSLQQASHEFPSPRAVHSLLLTQLQELRGVWRRQADEALMNLPMIMGAHAAVASQAEAAPNSKEPA